jgi:hypothetical protein
MSAEMNPVEPEYYSPAELARKVGMSAKWVEAHTQARRIPGQTQMGRAWRYEKAAIHAGLASGQLLLPKGARGGEEAHP